MSDVNIDDLIAKDKQKSKLKGKARRDGGREQRGRGRLNRRGSGGHPRSNFRNDRDRNDKRKPINKHRLDKDRSNLKKNKFNKFDKNRDRPRQRDDRRQPEKKERQTKKPKQQTSKPQKGRTLKVLGLHPDITNQDLYKLFAAEGALQKCMIQQDNFGRNLPSALVKYYSAETAQKAIQNINSKKVMNSVLTVEPYKHNRK